MHNTVRIIAQSKIYNVAEEVNEEHAERRLLEIKNFYNELLKRNNKYEDEGLLVTTTLIKRNV